MHNIIIKIEKTNHYNYVEPDFVTDSIFVAWFQKKKLAND